MQGERLSGAPVERGSIVHEFPRNTGNRASRECRKKNTVVGRKILLVSHPKKSVEKEGGGIGVKGMDWMVGL